MPGSKSRTTRKSKKRSAGQRSSLAAATKAQKENQPVAKNLPAITETFVSSQMVSLGVSRFVFSI